MWQGWYANESISSLSQQNSTSQVGLIAILLQQCFAATGKIGTGWKNRIILEVQIGPKTINISKKHERSWNNWCYCLRLQSHSSVIHFGSRPPGLWKQSPRYFGGVIAQSQNLYMVGGLEQAPEIWVPLHSPDHGLVVGNHFSIQLTFHDFYMRYPT